jgi:hypothetical protein
MTDRTRAWIVVGVLLSAFGGWYHNVTEGFSTTSPESISILVPAVLLLVWWYLGPGRAVWWTTLIWIGVLNLIIGAIITVLPLSVLPFEPEQSLSHYGAHAAYLVTQLPALYALRLARHDQLESASP